MEDFLKIMSAPARLLETFKKVRSKSCNKVGVFETCLLYKGEGEIEKWYFLFDLIWIQ